MSIGKGCYQDPEMVEDSVDSEDSRQLPEAAEESAQSQSSQELPAET